MGWRDHAHGGFPNRRVRRKRHVASEHDHHGAHALREAVHRSTRVLGEKQRDGQRGAHTGADLDVHAEQGVEAESGSCDVADVECEPAQSHQHREEVAQPREHPVGDSLSGRARRDQDAPDVELRREVNEHRHEDREREAGAELVGEDHGLREEAGPDGRRGHEERGAKEDPDPCAGWGIRGHEPAVPAEPFVTMGGIR